MHVTLLLLRPQARARKTQLQKERRAAQTPQQREATNKKRRDRNAASRAALEQAEAIVLATGVSLDGVPIDIHSPSSSMQSAVDDDITQHTGDFDDEFDAELKKLDSLIAKSRAIIDSKQRELKASSNS